MKTISFGVGSTVMYSGVTMTLIAYNEESGMFTYRYGGYNHHCNLNGILPVFIGGTGIDNTNLTGKVWNYSAFNVKTEVDTVKSEYSGMRIDDYGTGNCQVAIVAYFASALDAQTAKKDIASTFMASNRKKLLLVDIKEYYADTLKKLFTPEDIVTETPYKSSNGSKMCIYLLKTDKLPSWLVTVTEPKEQPKEIAL